MELDSNKDASRNRKKSYMIGNEEVIVDSKFQDLQHFQRQWKDQCKALQKLLKEQHSMLWTQNEQKSSFEKKLSDIIVEYHRNKIQSYSSIKPPSNINQKVNQKESKKIKEKIKQTWEQVKEPFDSNKSGSIQRISQQKVLLQDQGFEDSCFYIKEILLSLSKDPSLMITLIKKHQALAYSQNVQSLVKAIVHSMYENIVDDDIYNKDLFIILNESFKLITQNAKSYNDIKLNEDKSIAALIVRQFLQKSQVKNYSKQVLRNMVLQIGKIDHQVSFNSEENDKDSKKQRQNTSSLGLNNFRAKKTESKNESPVKDQKLNPKSKVDNSQSKIILYSQALQVKDQKMKINRSNSSDEKQNSTRSKNVKCVSKQLLKYLGISEQIQFPTFVSTSANTQIKKQEQINKQWAAMLSHKQSMSQVNPDIILIKNIVLIFFSDLFKMLYALPLSLRIACKIFYSNLQKKFSSKKGCFYVLAEYVLGLCVIKNITFDEKIPQKTKTNTVNYVKSNFSTFSSIIMGVIRNDYRNIPKAFQYQFNLIVSNLRISLFNYLTEIINIDATKINQLLSRNPGQILTNCQKIKSYSVCLSISDVKRLFQMIKFCKAQLASINKNEKLMKRIDRIQMVTEGKDIFKQREDKKTKQVYQPQNAYIMFYQLQLPKQLSVNYIKYHDGYFKNDKFKKMLKTFLLSIRVVDNFTQFHQEKTLFGFLSRLSSKSKEYFEINSMVHIQNIDHVPVEIKIKYLVSLIKNNFQQNQYSSQLFQIVSAMYKEAIQRTQYYKTIWDKSKQCFLKALSSVMYLNQVLINSDNIIRKNIKNKKLDQFIAKTKVSLCLTSPKTRQKQIVTKTNIVKDLLEDQKSKIWLQNQSRCIHTALNLEFIKSLTSQPDKVKKQDSHINSIMKFADVLCSLPQIRSNSAEDVGVKETFFEFIKYCCDLAIKQQESPIFSEDIQWLEESFQQKLSKKIYEKLYPKDPTYEDVAFYLRLKTLDFITYSHLKIKQCLRFDKMWQLAGRHLRMMDKVKTAGQKLHCIEECSKIIVNSYHLINQSDDPASAQDIYPIFVYVLIKAAPKRLISNITFIEYFANQNKLMSKQGYAFTQLKSAIQFCDNLTEEGLEYDTLSPSQKIVQFRKTIYQKQIEYGIYFLLLRKNTSHEVQSKSIQFLKDFFSNFKA